MAHFEIKDLSFSYASEKNGRLSLDSVNLSIETGEYVVLCGKSGSGKTTLLRHLKSVLAPAGRKNGEILFEGRKLEDVSEREQSSRIGFVMQNPDNQIVTDKVWHELAFGLENLGTDPKMIRLRVAEMASYFGIQNWFNKDVSELSGGQKQLLNLASIMAMQPSVLILDEPASQLDPIAAADFLNTVRKINLELGTTVIITEHRLEDILHAADKVVVMDEGRITACESPDKIGKILKENNNDMFAAMPVPVQFYYEMTARIPETGRAACPLTVREGRSYLQDILNGKDIRFKKAAERKNNITGSKSGKDAVTVKDLWFRYEKNGADVIKNLSMNVPSGCLFAVLGGNGTGKSTMLKCISGTVKPYRGSVYIEGKKLDRYRSNELFRKNLAMLPQDPLSLFVGRTLREDLMEMAKDNEKAIRQVSMLCEISHLLDTHPYDLSGGEQQRGALAKVLLTEPEILLLDEPTKGIDSFFKIKFADILKRLTGAGITVVMVSHDVEFCAKYADYVGMFFDGQLLTVNTPDEFFAGNSFYTTAANRMSRNIFENAVTVDSLTELCVRNIAQTE